MKRKRHNEELGKVLYRNSTVYELTRRHGLTSMVASTTEHLEKLARGGGLVDTVKGESLLGSFDKAGRRSVFIDGSWLGQ